VSNYRIVIHGVRPGYSTEQVAQQLARFSKKPPATLRSLLSSNRPLLAKRTPDMQPALRYKQLLEQLGCDCKIEAEITREPSASNTNNATTSLTDFTTSPSGSALPPAREFQYRKASFRTHFRDLINRLRLKQLTLISFLGVLFYYGWANGYLQ
jgi:hypothetical protein